MMGKFSSAGIVCFFYLLIGPSVSAAPVAAGDDDLSAYSSAWRAILKEADIEARFVAAQQEQRRQLFVAGKLMLDCCSSLAWRQRPEETIVQLFTEPFFYGVDHYIVRDDNPNPPVAPADMKDRRVAVVTGFDYAGAQFFGNRVETLSIDAALAAVADGRADVTIVNVQEFMRLQRRTPRPLVVGGEHARVDLRARVHRDHADLLPRLNRAIAKLRANGRIEMLVGASLRAARQDSTDGSVGADALGMD